MQMLELHDSIENLRSKATQTGVLSPPFRPDQLTSEFAKKTGPELLTDYLKRVAELGGESTCSQIVDMEDFFLDPNAAKRKKPAN
jgi:hypothetical protein